MGANAMKKAQHFDGNMWHIDGEKALLQNTPRETHQQ
jgi:hypothetical protein